MIKVRKSSSALCSLRWGAVVSWKRSSPRSRSWSALLNPMGGALLGLTIGHPQPDLITLYYRYHKPVTSTCSQMIAKASKILIQISGSNRACPAVAAYWQVLPRGGGATASASGFLLRPGRVPHCPGQAVRGRPGAGGRPRRSNARLVAAGETRELEGVSIRPSLHATITPITPICRFYCNLHALLHRSLTRSHTYHTNHTPHTNRPSLSCPRTSCLYHWPLWHGRSRTERGYRSACCSPPSAPTAAVG